MSAHVADGVSSPHTFTRWTMGKRETFDDWYRKHLAMRRSVRQHIAIIDAVESEQEYERQRPIRGESLLDNAERKAIRGQK